MPENEGNRSQKSEEEKIRYVRDYPDGSDYPEAQLMIRVR